MKIVQPKRMQVKNNGGSVNIPTFNEEADCVFMQMDANRKSPSILFKFDKKIVGHLKIKLKSHSNDDLLIEYGPYKDCIFFKETICLNGKSGEIVTDGIFALQWVRLSLVDKSTCPEYTYLEFSDFSILETTYEYERLGQFNCNDFKLNKIWETGIYTVNICSQPNKFSCNYFHNLDKERQKRRNEWVSKYGEYVIYDAPRRDKEAWIGDLRTEALALYAAFNNPRPVKATLDLFYSLQDERGIVPGSGTSCQPFLTYNLWWIVSIWENYLYSGDYEFLKYIYPGVKKLEEYLINNLDEDGFLPNASYDNTWMWTFPRGKMVASVQAELYIALECLQKIENEFGNTAAVKILKESATKLKSNFNKRFFNAEKGVYDECVNLKFDRMPVFLDVNAYAVAFGLCEAERANAVLDYLKNNCWTPYGTTTTDYEIESAQLTEDRNGMMVELINKNGIKDTIRPHNYKIWAFMVAYEVEANFILGRTDDAFEIINRTWGNMLNRGANTFWEMCGADGKFCNFSFVKQSKHDCIDSAAHGWSGWCAHLMTKYIGGISPITAGFSKFLIKPQIGKLKKINIQVPTPYGTIKLAIKAMPNQSKITLACPKECEPIWDFSYFKNIPEVVVIKEK